jgi:hypothetical protein
MEFKTRRFVKAPNVFRENFVGYTERRKLDFVLRMIHEQGSEKNIWT